MALWSSFTGIKEKAQQGYEATKLLGTNLAEYAINAAVNNQPVPARENAEEQPDGELTIFAQSLQIIRSVPDVLQHEKVQVAAKKASEFGTSTFDYVATTINEFAYGPIPIDCRKDPQVTMTLNYNCKSLMIGYHQGYNFYKLDHTGGPSNNAMHNLLTNEPVKFVEQVFGSVLILYVLASKPYKLIFHNYETNKEINRRTYLKTILSIRLTRQKDESIAVVCFEDEIQLHKILKNELYHRIRLIESNLLGVMDVTPNCKDGLIAYPASKTALAVFNIERKEMVREFEAHKSPLAALKFSPDGKHLATACIKGTQIRIYDPLTGNLVIKFDRGFRSVDIYSLAFSADSSLLAVTSNAATVHVFNVEPTSASKKRYTARLPICGVKAIAGFPSPNKNDLLYVTTSNGRLFVYEIPMDLVKGGDCRLKHEYPFVSVKDPATEKELDKEDSSLDSTVEFIDEEDRPAFEEMLNQAEEFTIVDLPLN